MGKRLIATAFAGLAGVALLATGCSDDVQVPESCPESAGLSVRIGAEVSDPQWLESVGDLALSCTYEIDGEPALRIGYHDYYSDESLPETTTSRPEVFGPCKLVEIDGTEEACMRTAKSGDAPTEIILRTERSLVSVHATERSASSAMRSSQAAATGAAEVVVDHLANG